MCREENGASGSANTDICHGRQLEFLPVEGPNGHKQFSHNDE